MKKYLALLICLVSVSFANPKPSDEINYRNSTQIGVNAGFVSGLGPNITHWFDKHGFQISILPIFKHDEDGTNGFLDLSVNHLYALAESKQRTLFGYQTRSLSYLYWGAHYFVEKTQGRDYDYTYYEDYSYSGKLKYYDDVFHLAIVGGGYGVQTIIGDISLSIGVGYAGAFDVQMDMIADKIVGEPSLRLMPTFDGKISYVFGK